MMSTILKKELVFLGDKHLIILSLDDVLRLLERVLILIGSEVLGQTPVQPAQLLVFTGQQGDPRFEILHITTL